MIENYTAFWIIKDVTSDWKESSYLNAELNKYINIIRKAKELQKLFINGITRKMSVKLSSISISFPWTKSLEPQFYDKEVFWNRNLENYVVLKRIYLPKPYLNRY